MSGLPQTTQQMLSDEATEQMQELAKFLLVQPDGTPDPHFLLEGQDLVMPRTPIIAEPRGYSDPVHHLPLQGGAPARSSCHPDASDSRPSPVQLCSFMLTNLLCLSALIASFNIL